MSKRSGKYAYVDGVPCTQGWQVSEANSASRYSASCSPDGSVVVPGNIDVTGSVSGMGYLPFLPEEDDFEFIGVASGKAGELLAYKGDALVSEATLNIPVADGTPINWTSNFGVQGLLTKDITTEYLDDTRDPAPSAKFGAVKIATIAAPTVFNPVDGVQSITLTFRRPPTTSVENGATVRETGNLEVDLSFEVRNDDKDIAMYDANALGLVRVYVTATLFYEFDAFVFKDKTNFQVSRAAGSMIGYTVNAFWTALRTRTPAALGHIKRPDGSYLYGGA